MIIVPIFGGLGNQMFQYAFLRAASTALRRSAVMDLTGLPTGKHPHRREFGLMAFPIHPKVLRLGTGRTPAHRTTEDAWRTVGKFASARLRHYTIREDPTQDALIDVGNIPSPVAFCIGYWQSPLYFSDLEDEIRGELMPPASGHSRVATLLKQVRGRESVAVHIRRGDYAERESTLAFHGLVAQQYYTDAVNSIAAQLTDSPIIIVFSDDPAWAERSLAFDYETIHAESESGLSTMDALALMSRCRHHVIANSTFSWWGAWLAGHRDQRVIYPERWFRSRSVDAGFRFPAHWQSMPS